MHIHIIGVCGTFMGGVARLAVALGHRVSGSDQNIYPPMSDQLQALGIELQLGYAVEHLQPRPERVIIGNALSRGNVEVEAVLEQGLDYVSGAQWLYEEVLRGRWVLAVAGTHGKTTTASLLAWLLEAAGYAPGFLIGGVPNNFTVTARLGASRYFVVEADEYDTAFFDKRSKFVHYRPRTLILNNLEYDHADIFPDLAAIQRQFHHLIRTVPAGGLIIKPLDDQALTKTIEQGCWSRLTQTSLERSAGVEWCAELLAVDGSQFRVWHTGVCLGEVHWAMMGAHNVRNAMAAVAAAVDIGVDGAAAVAALAGFSGVKRRMEIVGSAHGVTIYDDFAHHPTAITVTLQGLRARVGRSGRIVAVVEPRSNTMRLGTHAGHLAAALRDADVIWVYQAPNLAWDARAVLAGVPDLRVVEDLDVLVQHLVEQRGANQHWIFMSNGGFGGVQRKALAALREV